jgi:hypothetical protein
MRKYIYNRHARSGIRCVRSRRTIWPRRWTRAKTGYSAYGSRKGLKEASEVVDLRLRWNFCPRVVKSTAPTIWYLFGHYLAIIISSININDASLNLTKHSRQPGMPVINPLESVRKRDLSELASDTFPWFPTGSNWSFLKRWRTIDKSHPLL